MSSNEKLAVVIDSGNAAKRPFTPVYVKLPQASFVRPDPLHALAEAVALHKPQPVNPYSWRKMAFFGLSTELAVLSAFTCLGVGAAWNNTELQVKLIVASVLVGTYTTLFIRPASSKN